MRSGHLFLLLAGMLISSAAPGQGAQPAEKSFLWRVSEGHATVHLLGSIHYMKKDAYPLSQAVEDAFGASEVVVFETDIEALNEAAVSLLAAGTLSGDLSLADTVSEELYAGVTRRLDDLGMNIAGFRKMKPWMVALSLTSFELMRGGYLGSDGIDSTFSTRAKADGKAREGLESTEFQVSLFAELSPKESTEFLEYTLDELDAVVPEVDEIVAAWRLGDTKRIEELLADGLKEHPRLFERLVSERNHRWLPAIEMLLRGERDAMVIVGALHLVGEQGLIELLKAKGYEVEQL